MTHKWHTNDTQLTHKWHTNDTTKIWTATTDSEQLSDVTWWQCWRLNVSFHPLRFHSISLYFLFRWRKEKYIEEEEKTNKRKIMRTGCSVRFIPPFCTKTLATTAAQWCWRCTVDDDSSLLSFYMFSSWWNMLWSLLIFFFFDIGKMNAFWNCLSYLHSRRRRFPVDFLSKRKKKQTNKYWRRRKQ